MTPINDLNFNLQLEQKRQQMIKENIQNINTNSQTFKQKLQYNYNMVKYIQQNLSFQDYEIYVKTQLQNGDLNTQLLYMTNPTRQNIYEPLQITLMTEYLQPKYNLPIKFQRFTNINLNQQSKTIDGIDIKNKIILNCKYVQQSGGAQDNQIQDLLQFNINLSQTTYKDYVNYLVISGEYGIKQIKQIISNKNFELKPNTYICVLDNNIEELQPQKKPNIQNIPTQNIPKLTSHYSIDPQLIYNVDLSVFFNLSNFLKRKTPKQKVPKHKLTIVEPFCGEYDLINLFQKQLDQYENQIEKILCYDIKCPSTTLSSQTLSSKIKFQQKDTLLNNVYMQNKPIEEQVEDIFTQTPTQQNHLQIVITNPPYLAKNKIKVKIKNTTYQKILSKHQDLYEVFIQQLIDSQKHILGGFIIVPLNFLTGQKQKSLFKSFLNVFDLLTINIFEKQIFKNTAQCVICVQFLNRSFLNRSFVNSQCLNQKQTFQHKYTLFKKDNTIINLEEDIITTILNFEFGQSKNQTKHNTHSNTKSNTKLNTSIYRYQPSSQKGFVSNIRLQLVDDSKKQSIKATLLTNEEVEKIKRQSLISDRYYILVCFSKSYTLEQQKTIVSKFNELINNIRQQTHSLVLTSYREFERKRLTFQQAFDLLDRVLQERYRVLKKFIFLTQTNTKTQSDCTQKEHTQKDYPQNTHLQKHFPLDQFFTVDPKLITQLWKQEIQKYFTDTHPLIEPSAGDGRFGKYVAFDKMYDIQPFNISPFNNISIIKQDFLTTTDQNAHYLGNPPFGNVANLANKFIKHCCSNNAQSISFILPRSFRKESMKKVFNEYYHLVFEYDYDQFETPYHQEDITPCVFQKKIIPCVFQIWIKRDYKRPTVIKQMTNQYFQFVNPKTIQDNIQNYYNIRRVGITAGQLNKGKDVAQSSHYFIRFNENVDVEQFIKEYSKIKFVCDKNTGQKSLSKPELNAYLEQIDQKKVLKKC